MPRYPVKLEGIVPASSKTDLYEILARFFSILAQFPDAAARGKALVSDPALAGCEFSFDAGKPEEDAPHGEPWKPPRAVLPQQP